MDSTVRDNCAARWSHACGTPDQPPIFKGRILDSRSSSKPGLRVKKSKQSNNDSVEQLEESMLSESITAAPPVSVRQERRKGHQMISTATYYRAERRRSFGYAQHDEADDWLMGGMDTDGGLTEGDV
jgi:hypothetical protein